MELYGHKTGMSFNGQDTMEEKTLKPCPKHGLDKVRLNANGKRICNGCQSELVTEHRRRLKRNLVARLGGKCIVCGYNRCVRSLQFHHLNPSEKEFTISEWKKLGKRDLEKEIKKCVLVCANCHGEIESGYITLGNVSPHSDKV